MPTLQAVNANYRARLERLEAATLRDMLNAYEVAQNALEPTINALAEDMDDLDEPNQAKLFQLERYRILGRQLEAEMARLTAVIENRIVQDQAAAIALGQEAAAQQIRAAWGEQYGEAAADALRLTRLPADQLADLVGMLSPESPLRASLDRLGPIASEQVRNGLIRGMVLGQGPRQTARQVRDAFGGNAAHALRVSRTATLYAHRSSALRLFNENDDVVRGWRWNAAKSARTCAACLALDGRIFALDEPMRSHHNCRCAPSPVVRGSRLTVETGEQWFTKQSNDVQRSILGIAAHRALQSGQVALDDFVGQRDDPVLGTVYQVRSLKSIVGERRQRELMTAN